MNLTEQGCIRLVENVINNAFSYALTPGLLAKSSTTENKKKRRIHNLTSQIEFLEKKHRFWSQEVSWLGWYSQVFDFDEEKIRGNLLDTIMFTKMQLEKELEVLSKK